MTSPEPVEIALARLDERTKGTADDVAEIKLNMATKTDQAHIDQRIAGLTGALEKEAAERKAAVDVERTERIAGDEKNAARLQVVEDRQEARKFHVLISIILSATAAVFAAVASIVVAASTRLIGG